MNHEITHYVQLAQQQGRVSEPIQFPLLLSKVRMPQGNFNTNTVLEDHQGNLFIHRVENPSGRALELPYVIAEYQGVGFLDNPLNGFHLRSSVEQRDFAAALRAQRIPATRCVFAEQDTQIIIYEPRSTSLAALWEVNDPHTLAATAATFSALLSAHEKGFVLGDRWGPNELIISENSVIFADFDIALTGPEARECEIASLMYFLSYFAQGSDQLDDLQRLYGSLFASYCAARRDTLGKYILSYAEYFSRGQKI